MQLLISLSVILAVNRTLGCDMSVVSLFEIQNDSYCLIFLASVITKLLDDAIAKAEK